MAYGEGRTKLYADVGKEAAFERGRYESELLRAEEAYKKDQEQSSLWQLFFSSAGAGLGFAVGGKEGAQIGYAAGKETGKWGHRSFSKMHPNYGYDPEDYAITTDPGKFDVTQKYALEEINKMFLDADESRFWKDLTDTGTTIGSLYTFGSENKEADWMNLLNDQG